MQPQEAFLQARFPDHGRAFIGEKPPCGPSVYSEDRTSSGRPGTPELGRASGLAGPFQEWIH